MRRKIAVDFKRKSIRSQLILYIGLFVVLPLCLGLMVLNFYLQRVVKENLMSYSSSSLAQIKDNADQVIEVTNYSASMLMINSEVLERLRIMNGEGEDSYEVHQAKTELSNRILEVESSVLNAFNGKMAILTNSGYLIGSNHLSRSKLEYEGEEWYQDILKNGRKSTFCPELSGFFREMTASTVKDYQYLYIGRSILDYSGKKQGVLLTQLSGAKIWGKFIQSLAASGQGSFYILNKDKQIQMEYNGEEGKAKERMSGLYSKWQSGTGNGLWCDYAEGDCYMAMPLEYYGNLLVYQVPERELLRESSGIFRAILLLVLLLILLTVALMIYFSGKLSRPLTEVARKLEQSDSGILSLDVPAHSFWEIRKFVDSYNRAGRRIEELIERVKVESHLKEKARYEMLISQISPHFIFNTVNSIRLMAREEQDEKAERALGALGEILRGVFRNREGMTTVGQETALLSAYVDIMRMRFGSTFQYYNVIPTELYFYEIPAFTMQPIVENAILHGVKDVKAGQIIVSAVEYERDFVILIFNNGHSAEREVVERLLNTPQNNRRSFTGMGLYNVNSRLKMLYGDSYGLIYNEQVKTGFEMWIRVPKRRAKNAGESDGEGSDSGR